jgi:hypothetical protein
MHRHALLAAAVLLAAFSTACQRHEAAPAAASDSSLSPVSSSFSSSTSSGDPIGVSECDDFLRAFHDCVDNKVPEASRADLNTSMEQSVALWRQAAATPEGKAGLGVACSQNRDTMKSSLSQYGCSL